MTHTHLYTGVEHLVRDLISVCVGGGGLKLVVDFGVSVSCMCLEERCTFQLGF